VSGALDVLIDVSRPLREGMAVWPGDTPFRRRVLRSPGPIGPVTVSALTLSSHAGTHVDAPLHVDSRAGGVETLDLGRFVGPALVIDARGRQALSEDLVPLDALTARRRLLFRTDCTSSGARVATPGAGAGRNERSGEAFTPRAPFLTPALARAAAAAGVPLVGVDGPSVDPFESETLEAHRLLAAGGVAILEGLDLSRAQPGEWMLIALPLLLEGCDGAPVRAALARTAGRTGSD
jgi:arylformamidase